MAIITISRGSFSGGRTLARCVAERLGYPCLDREGVLKAAAGYGIPVETLVSAMEEPPSFWQRLTGYRNRYLNYVRAALCEHIKDGNLVYHGHAGHLLLPEIPQVIRIRVIADMELRIASVLRTQKLTRKEAIAYIEKMDRQRVLWTRFLYGVEWSDPSLYDVVLNINRMGFAGACDVVVTMTETEAFMPTPQSLKAVENLIISSRVWAALATNGETAAADLEVTVDNSVATISGVTPYPHVLNAIPSVASRVAGVKEVRCLVRETSKTYP